ncbi:S66 family peptidase [Sporosarcina limicola]|uniref:Muramoyltetrapeptide carboxypeptidase LdcA involved in peptidoglycan recycling n=1 Tax=Sporosarcina limicola TaxID=34101 RepID=A0A927R4I3_9BACL|nr:S66 peptidase family protein [Sporosarcina limicola]MBE1554928.1 muramoyltetrapeptide carboxypeptidase LdcA involved in peptidoglycan recycling [Sporosarcina limicola]
MIRYPNPLRTGQTIGVTAPSSGVGKDLHSLLQLSKQQFEKRGFKVEIGDTAWSQIKAASATKEVRAAELTAMLNNSTIGAIIPPWGGEILMEILPLIHWDEIEPKWILGYSDLSTLLFSLTLKTGIATAHGTNFIDLRSDEWDSVTGKFLEVLSASTGSVIEQQSSKKFQSEWQHFAPLDPYVFKLDSETRWEIIGGGEFKIEGRFLGGCLDTIGKLVGTPYGDVAAFQKNHLNDEPILWYLENCEMSATDFHRTVLHFAYAGWFDNAAGIIFGRSPAGQSVDGFTVVDSMERLQELTGLPIAYNADIGHVPPQITFVNGAYGSVSILDGEAVISTEFK